MNASAIITDDMTLEEKLSAIDAAMKAAQEAAEKSQQLVAQTSRQLKDRYAELSKEVGITITNMDQFDQLLADGVIHLDQATGFYKRGAAGIKEIGTSADIAAPLVTKRRAQARNWRSASTRRSARAVLARSGWVSVTQAPSQLP